MNIRITHIATNTKTIISLERLISGMDKTSVLGAVIIERETGIKDYNGDMIFEGDIIECEYPSIIGTTYKSQEKVVWNSVFCTFILFTKSLIKLSDCFNIKIVR
jgi:hypothetical protein